MEEMEGHAREYWISSWNDEYCPIVVMDTTLNILKTLSKCILLRKSVTTEKNLVKWLHEGQGKMKEMLQIKTD